MRHADADFQPTLRRKFDLAGIATLGTIIFMILTVIGGGLMSYQSLKSDQSDMKERINLHERRLDDMSSKLQDVKELAIKTDTNVQWLVDNEKHHKQQP